MIEKLNSAILQTLLVDRTTQSNIIWATTEYESYGTEFKEYQEITLSVLQGLHGNLIEPRIRKSDILQKKRTQSRAEVFTPAWICNLQNNVIDEAWFGRKNIFNIPQGKTWQTITERVIFPGDVQKTWQKYVDAKRLEITCGEAPYLVSPYDAVTGESIPLPTRIGLLDRKLRVVNENVTEEGPWIEWVIRAFQSVYGYEFQGDNVLIARMNLLDTFIEYVQYRWHREPSLKELKNLAWIISWNIWQMDAMTGTIPYSVAEEKEEQMSLFDDIEPEIEQGSLNIVQPYCRIMDWRTHHSVEFREIQ